MKRGVLIIGLTLLIFTSVWLGQNYYIEKTCNNAEKSLAKLNTYISKYDYNSAAEEYKVLKNDWKKSCSSLAKLTSHDTTNHITEIMCELKSALNEEEHMHCMSCIYQIRHCVRELEKDYEINFHSIL